MKQREICLKMMLHNYIYLRMNSRIKQQISIMQKLQLLLHQLTTFPSHFSLTSNIFLGCRGAKLCVRRHNKAEEMEYLYPGHLTLSLPFVLFSALFLSRVTESPVGGSLGAWNTRGGKGMEEACGFGQKVDLRESMLFFPRQLRFYRCLGQAQVASLVISRSWQGPRAQVSFLVWCYRTGVSCLPLILLPAPILASWNAEGTGLFPLSLLGYKVESLWRPDETAFNTLI